MGGPREKPKPSATWLMVRDAQTLLADCEEFSARAIALSEWTQAHPHERSDIFLGQFFASNERGVIEKHMASLRRKIQELVGLLRGAATDPTDPESDENRRAVQLCLYRHGLPVDLRLAIAQMVESPSQPVWHQETFGLRKRRVWVAT